MAAGTSFAPPPLVPHRTTLSCSHPSIASGTGRRKLHSLSRPRAHSWISAKNDVAIEIRGVPLQPDELLALQKATDQMAAENPELARALVTQWQRGAFGPNGKPPDAASGAAPVGDGAAPGAAVPSPQQTLATLDKVGNAKLRKQQGRGKTALFSYLSDVDKARVLHFTRAEGAEAVAREKYGRTAFFAALDGVTKYNALKSWQQEREASSSSEDALGPDGHPIVPAPPRAELLRLFLSQAVPMLGFGFADNFLMICFGESIDAHFGIYVTTMAAAGLGNLCSNLAGLSLADYIEHASARIGIEAPKLTPAQRQLPSARVSSLGGTVTGVTVGCLLGLVPLLFITREEAEARAGPGDGDRKGGEGDFSPP